MICLGVSDPGPFPLALVLSSWLVVRSGGQSWVSESCCVRPPFSPWGWPPEKWGLQGVWPSPSQRCGPAAELRCRVAWQGSFLQLRVEAQEAGGVRGPRSPRPRTAESCAELTAGAHDPCPCSTCGAWSSWCAGRMAVFLAPRWEPGWEAPTKGRGGSGSPPEAWAEHFPALARGLLPQQQGLGLWPHLGHWGPGQAFLFPPHGCFSRFPSLWGHPCPRLLCRLGQGRGLWLTFELCRGWPGGASAWRREEPAVTDCQGLCQCGGRGKRTFFVASLRPVRCLWVSL